MYVMYVRMLGQNREGGVVGTDEDSERSSVVGAGGAGAGASSEKLSLQHELSLRSLMVSQSVRMGRMKTLVCWLVGSLVDWEVALIHF